MRFGSVCSGIEAASVAWHPLGWKAAWLSEIEPFPSAVLAHHYPDVPNLGDMTTLPDRIASGEVEAPDLFCGGTPCQAFSVAGLRKSLDDARGNLSMTFCEIANAIDTARAGASQPPAIIFWENVPGVLSTKDNAFGCFIAGLAGETDPVEPPRGKWPNAGVVLGPQRTVAWRILDAQYFGVAQRRRRVFVVASARDGFDPASVLFEFDGVRRDSAPSREAGKVAPTISSSGTGVSCVGFNCEDEWFIETAVAASMETQPIALHPTQDPISSADVCHSIGANDNATAAVAQPVGVDIFNAAFSGDVAVPLTNRSDGTGTWPTLMQGMAVRRLTPVECERLQGFPDNYTNIPWRKKPASECPDGPRYKALGNSWAVPVVRWIGKRIQEALT